MTDLFENLQEFRVILCVCPCCGELVRVSDLRLKTKHPAARTWLDDYESKSQTLGKKEEKFGEIEEKLRELAVERGRRAAEKVISSAMCPGLRSLKIDPFDIKPILNPIDFVVFKGMNAAKEISDIIMLCKDCDSHTLNSARKAVQTAVLKKNYDWQVARIGEEGNISFE